MTPLLALSFGNISTTEITPPRITFPSRPPPDHASLMVCTEEQFGSCSSMISTYLCAMIAVAKRLSIIGTIMSIPIKPTGIFVILKLPHKCTLNSLADPLASFSAYPSSSCTPIIVQASAPGPVVIPSATRHIPPAMYPPPAPLTVEPPILNSNELPTYFAL